MEKDIELIEKYLFGKLSEQERSNIEQRIQSDKGFADEVAFIRDLRISAKEFRKEELKAKLKGIAEEHKSKDVGKIPGLNNYLKIAASIVIIIGIASFFYYLQNKNVDNTNSFVENTADSIIINEINELILNSKVELIIADIQSNNTGYGYAETDSLNGKLIVRLIDSKKFKNHYLMRDTLFLFMPSQDSFSFYTTLDFPNKLFFTGKDSLRYSIELVFDGKLREIVVE